MTLRISPDLSLPLSFITQTQAILAKKRTGKSYTASVQAEELLKAGQQIVVLDVTGAWWGLRSSSDGKRSGFPILVAGGEHGDIPLEQHAGEVMAQAIVSDGFSCILDMSLFRKGETHRFLAPFLETLYRSNRSPVYLFADEADFYAPQKPFGEEARTLGAMSDVVRRGGIRGIGTTLITQRPAVLSKDVLTQCDILSCLRIVHHRDIAAIKEWIDVHEDPAQAKKMIADLPSLPIGTAWVWSSAWPKDDVGIFQRVRIRKRETFDSGAMPKPGEKVAAPKVLAQVDVERLGKAIKDTAEKAKENDPKHLRAELQKLRAQVAAGPAKPVEKIVEKEVPVLKGKELERVEKLVGRLEEAGNKALAEAAELRRQIAPAAAPRPAPAPVRPVPAARPVLPRRAAAPLPGADSGSSLPEGERKILTAVAQYQDGASRETLTVLTGYKRSSRDTYLQRLRQRGFIDQAGDRVLATPEGIDALGPDFAPLPTGEDLQRYWLERLPEGECKVLEVLISAYPAAVPRSQIDDQTGYRRSSRDTYLQRLRGRRLVEFVGPGEVQASECLF